MNLRYRRLSHSSQRFFDRNYECFRRIPRRQRRDIAGASTKHGGRIVDAAERCIPDHRGQTGWASYADMYRNIDTGFCKTFSPSQGARRVEAELGHDAQARRGSVSESHLLPENVECRSVGEIRTTFRMPGNGKILDSETVEKPGFKEIHRA